MEGRPPRQCPCRMRRDSTRQRSATQLPRQRAAVNTTYILLLTNRLVLWYQCLRPICVICDLCATLPVGKKSDTYLLCLCSPKLDFLSPWPGSWKHAVIGLLNGGYFRLVSVHYPLNKYKKLTVIARLDWRSRVPCVVEAVQTKPNRGAKERACIVDTGQVTNEWTNPTRRYGPQDYELNGVNWSVQSGAVVCIPSFVSNACKLAPSLEITVSDNCFNWKNRGSYFNIQFLEQNRETVYC